MKSSQKFTRSPRNRVPTMARSWFVHNSSGKRKVLITLKVRMRVLIIYCGKVVASTRSKFPSRQRSEISFEKRSKLWNRKPQATLCQHRKTKRSQILKCGFYLRNQMVQVTKKKKRKKSTRSFFTSTSRLSVILQCVSQSLVSKLFLVFYVPETVCGASDRVKAAI
jgi:hypothetical protein